MKWLRLSTWIYLAITIILPLIALSTSLRISSLYPEPLSSNSFYNSLLIALSTTLIAGLIGGCAASLVVKTSLSNKRIWTILLIMPLLFVPYQSALAWSALLPPGILSKLIFSKAGVIFVLVGCFYPVAFWFVLVSLLSIPKEEEESGMLIAPPGTVFYKITLPKIFPSLITGGILVFLLAFTELGVPTYLGVTVLPYEVLIQFSTKYDFHAAVASTLPMSLVLLFLLLIEYRFLHQGFIFYQQRPASPALVFRLEGWILILAKLFLFTIVFIFLIIPFGTTLFEAAHLKALCFALKNGFKSLGRSIFYGLLAGIVASVWAILAIFANKGKGETSVSFLTLAGFFLPPPLIAIALIALWGQLSSLGIIYGSFLILVLGLLARFSLFSYRALDTAFENLERSSWETAHLITGSQMTILRKIVFPQVRLWFFLGILLVFIFSMNELGLSSILYPPNQEPLVVRLYTLSVNTPISFSSALTLLNSMGTLLVVIILYRWGMK